jgi:AraC-like DNA-binding protein
MSETRLIESLPASQLISFFVIRVVSLRGGAVLAKIAVSSRRVSAGRFDEPGRIEAQTLAAGDGWSVDDVVCSRGPHDPRFEEQHSRFVIAVVTSGTFQYRSSGSNREEMMTPGSVLLGSPGQCFECGHEHGVGDRCLAFHFTEDYFHRMTAGRGGRKKLKAFQSAKLSPVRTLSPIIADACAALAGSTDIAWEELGIRLSARALQLDSEPQPNGQIFSPAAVARVSESVRSIEEQSTAELNLLRLARHAGLSPFHYLRTFENVTGTTPHQYMLRTRLRSAAVRLVTGDSKVVDVAFESGFGDVSNFNRAFRAEFGMSPSRYRQRQRR